MNQPTREELIQLCERSIVPSSAWGNRDSAAAHLQLGQAWALLKAGCNFTIDVDASDEHSWNLDIEWEGFNAFEYGNEYGENLESDSFYIPTEDRLNKRQGGDWY